MSDNWVVQNLTNALETWNDKLSEIWLLITQSPENFKGGAIWSVIVSIHGALQAIGYALLVVFFVVGVMKTCGSFAEIKKPEHAVKLFVRFALACLLRPARVGFFLFCDQASASAQAPRRTMYTSHQRAPQMPHCSMRSMYTSTVLPLIAPPTSLAIA